MLGEMLDTSPESRRSYYQQLAALTPRERLGLMGHTSHMVRKLAEAGIRSRHPGISTAELQVRLAVRLYGREAVARWVGPIPLDAR